LALGAKSVFLSRPIAWGLSVNGQTGVKELLDILNEEFKLSMVLTNVMEIK